MNLKIAVTPRTKVYIPAKANKTHMFLYNKISKVVNEYKLPAEYKNDGITLPSITYEALEQIKAMGIKVV